MKTLWIALSMLMLTACANQAPRLDAPCPDFGAHCHKTPINGWEARD